MIIDGGLAELIKKGGVYRNIQGRSPREVLGALIGALTPVPSVPAEKLLGAVLEREDLMSTGIGGGIAIPHPRNPLTGPDSGQFVALAFPERPVDWNSLDGGKVDTILLIVSSSAKQHLKILSEISFFCRQEEFCRLLKACSVGGVPDDLLRFITEAEKNWN